MKSNVSNIRNCYIIKSTQYKISWMKVALDDSVSIRGSWAKKSSSYFDSSHTLVVTLGE